jgi:tetratricopeptide (TPR) repeat protein
MAKPQIIPLPFALLLWDYWPLKRLFPDPQTLSDTALNSGNRTKDQNSNNDAGRSLSSLILEKTPLFLLAAISAVITVIAQRSANAVHNLADYSIAVRIENCIVAYARYLADTFWPARLAPLYPHPGNSLATSQIAVSAAALLVTTALSIHWRDRRRYLAMGWFWFLGTLVPVIGLVQVGEQAIADRYMYLPELGIFIAIVWLAWDLAAEANISKTWLAVPAVAVLLALGLATYRQLGHWHDGETLWKYTLSVTQRNYMAHVNLAMVLAEQGRADEAIPEFRAAEQFHDYPASQFLSLGAYEQHNGHLQGAIEQYKRALQASHNPDEQTAAGDQIASAYSEVKDWQAASEAYDAALRLRPDDPSALVGSGLLAQRAGDSVRAVAQLSHAMNVAPTDVGFLLLAGALRQAGRNAEAEKAYAEAHRRSQDIVQAQKIATQVAGSIGVTLN